MIAQRRTRLEQFTDDELRRADEWLTFNSPDDDKPVEAICIILATQLGDMLVDRHA